MATKRPDDEPEIEGKSHKRQRRATGSAGAFLGENHDLATTAATPEKTGVDDGSIAAMQDSTRVAVLVPFRDNHPAQQRRAHLDEFVPYMTEFLQRHCASKRCRLQLARRRCQTATFLTFLVVVVISLMQCLVPHLHPGAVDGWTQV